MDTRDYDRCTHTVHGCASLETPERVRKVTLDRLILDAIAEESERAEYKHGPLPDSIDRQFMILMEEVGELAQAMIEASHGRGLWGLVENEGIQVASVAARIVAAVEHQKITKPPEKAPKAKAVHPLSFSDPLPETMDRDRYGKMVIGRGLGPQVEAPAYVSPYNWILAHQPHGGIHFDYLTEIRTCNCGAVYSNNKGDAA